MSAENKRAKKPKDISKQRPIDQGSIIHDLEAYLEQQRIDGRKMAYINNDGTTTPIE